MAVLRKKLNAKRHTSRNDEELDAVDDNDGGVSADEDTSEDKELDGVSNTNYHDTEGGDNTDGEEKEWEEPNQQNDVTLSTSMGCDNADGDEKKWEEPNQQNDVTQSTTSAGSRSTHLIMLQVTPHLLPILQIVEPQLIPISRMM